MDISNNRTDTLSIYKNEFSLEEDDPGFEKPHDSASKTPENNSKTTHNNPNNKHRVEAKKAEQKDLFDKLKELPHKANHVIQRARMFKRKLGNMGYYKKYLDRVESGLYERFGSAEVLENQMKGDPVQILKNEAQQYIQEIVHKLNELYQEVLKMSKELEDKTTAEACINVIKKYCSEYASDTNKYGNKIDQNKLSWKTKLLEATKFKIAKILMRNGERKVYGYTMRNMVQKGYPKPNHLIVTLFVENPEEKPQRQTVKDIFTDVKSFEIIGNADKSDVFNVSGMTEAVLSKTVNNNIMNEIKLTREAALKAFANANIPNKKDEGKIIDEIWDGIRDSCKELLTRKEYMIDCINVYFDMILRIDKLARKSIEAMLELENASMDKKYKNSLNVSHTRDKNEYDENDNLVSTKTQRHMDAVERNGNTYHGGKIVRSKNSQEIRDAVKKVNKLNM